MQNCEFIFTFNCGNCDYSNLGKIPYDANFAKSALSQDVMSVYILITFPSIKLTGKSLRENTPRNLTLTTL